MSSRQARSKLPFGSAARAPASAEDSAKLAKFFSSAVPQGRWGEPEEVAKAVLFLASDDSAYVNAVELVVDGGATGAPFGAPIFQDILSPLGSEAKLAKAHAGGDPHEVLHRRGGDAP
jgi:hypothetical protein